MNQGNSVYFGKLRTAAAMLHELLVPERMLGRKVVSGRVERFIHLVGFFDPDLA